MILPLYKHDHPILRQKGAKIEKVTPEIEQFALDLRETMKAARGVGLAAQQVGKAWQIAVIDVRGITDRESRMWVKGQPVNPEDFMPLVLINPETAGTKTKVLGNEGCLSFPGLTAQIARSRQVRVRTLTKSGEIFEFEAGGLLGRAVQHEVDHLHGRLFIDLLTPEARRELKEQIELIRETFRDCQFAPPVPRPEVDEDEDEDDEGEPPPHV